MKGLVRMSCPICLNEFEDARILGCGHTFCIRCLQRVKTERYSITCPSCKKIHSNIRDVTDLVKNFSALVSTTDKEVCPKHTQLPITHFCRNCKAPVCATCLISIHRDSNMHEIIELNNGAEEIKETLQLCLTNIDDNISLVSKKIKELERSLSEFQKMKQEILEVQDSAPGSLVLLADGLIESTEKQIFEYQLPSLTFEEIKSFFSVKIVEGLEFVFILGFFAYFLSYLPQFFTILDDFRR